MADTNVIVLVGRLTRDPELKRLPSGSAVCTIGLATSEKWKDKQSGQMREETCFVDVVYFNRQAEIAAEYLKKGSQVSVVGSLRQESWDDKETGKKRYRHSIKGRELNMLGNGGGGSRQESSEPVSNPVSGDVNEDEVPF